MTPLRVALVLERFVPALGGTERYAAGLARGLSARGHAVTVVCSEADPAALDGLARVEIPVARLPKAWRVWSFASRAREATAGPGGSPKYDVVHGLQKSLGHDVFQPHTGSHRDSLRAARRARPSALGRAAHAAGKWLSAKQWVFAAIERRQYTQAPPPVFVAVSDLVRRQMLEVHGVPADRVRLLPNPVDTTRLHPGLRAGREETRRARGAGPGEPLLLFAGHDFRLKGLEPALRALARLPAARLLVAGRERPKPWQ
ncbi:MAG: glycosyltransferase family 4 protein [Planctomycetales bacterium]|nr:glycosyltransferase family 4 protein [Planctomycetales bacterium]